ncbi:MAG: hypothetical protein IT384_35025 [Deltaproteobacteria bacterium]|nr:hypothetical protein [Deltaproteobacteria bacterium]
MTSDPNPFEAPKVSVSVPLDAGLATGEDERIRHAHLGHEAALQSVGFLWMLGAVFLVPAGIASIAGSVTAAVGGAGSGELGLLVMFGAVYLAMGVTSGWTGWALRRLDERARVPALILAAVGLLGFPVGTVISAYILYLVASAKGRTILSPEYRALAARTPHIRYRTSPWLIVVLVAFLMALGAALFYALR